MAHAATQPGMTIKPAEYQVPSVYSAGLHRHTPPRQGGIFGIATALPTRAQQPPAAGTRRGGVTPPISASHQPPLPRNLRRLVVAADMCPPEQVRDSVSFSRGGVPRSFRLTRGSSRAVSRVGTPKVNRCDRACIDTDHPARLPATQPVNAGRGAGCLLAWCTVVKEHERQGLMPAVICDLLAGQPRHETISSHQAAGLFSIDRASHSEIR